MRICVLFRCQQQQNTVTRTMADSANILAPKPDEQRTWEDVLSAFDSLISKGPPPKAPPGMAQQSLEVMHTCVSALGLKLDKIKYIHITGTKGKGSTAAITERIMRDAGLKTGLFTSPHLMDVRERIRVNGKLLNEELFGKYFWPVFDTLRTQTEAGDLGVAMPAYFRFLTLVALHIFNEENVDVAILEVGIGGLLDATNVIPPPVVAGISALGYDHQNILGHTLDAIATQKAGIFKKGSICVTVPQPAEAMNALVTYAKKVDAPLFVTQKISSYSTEGCTLPSGRVELKHMNGSFQRGNAALALALCTAFWAQHPREIPTMEGLSTACQTVWTTTIAKHPPPTCTPVLEAPTKVCPEVPQAPTVALRQTLVSSLEHAHWPGRCQVIPVGFSSFAEGSVNAVADVAVEGASNHGSTLFIDGAHTIESVQECGRWFGHASSSLASGQETSRAMIFNCSADRDPSKLLESLVAALVGSEIDGDGCCLDHALFVPSDSNKSTSLASPGHRASTRWQTIQAAAFHKALSQRASGGAAAGESGQAAGAGAGADGDDVDWSTGLIARGCRIRVVKSLLEGFQEMQRLQSQNKDEPLHALVTGSLYLAGDTLRLLVAQDRSSLLDL